MIQIRRGVFETNSSSTHSITMCTESDYDCWREGELLFDEWNEVLVTIQEAVNELRENRFYKGPDPDILKPEDFKDVSGERFFTYEQWYEDSWLETYEDSFTTPGGETVVAFGQYGYDG